MEEMLRIAEEVGSLQKRGVEFNANQYRVAEAVGTSQKTVSRMIQALRADGWIKRTSVGSKKKAKNSSYRLPIIGRVTPTLVTGDPPCAKGRSHTEIQIFFPLPPPRV